MPGRARQARPAAQTPQLVNSGTSGQLLRCLYTPWEGPRDNGVARRCRLPVRTFTWLGWKEGWDRRGLNKEASGVWGAVNHLLPPPGHDVRTVWRFPRCACPSAMRPSHRGQPRLPDPTGGAALAGDSFLLLKEWQAEAASGPPCEAGSRMEKDSRPHLLRPKFLQLPRYPEVSLRTLCFQEHQAPEPQLCPNRSPPGLSILPWQSWLGRDTSWELDEAPCGCIQGA